MRRIGLAVVLALGVFVQPLMGEAQQAGKVPRVGLLGTATPSRPHAIRAAQRATSTIPIVMAIVEDPVEQGSVASFGRPEEISLGFLFRIRILQRNECNCYMRPLQASCELPRCGIRAVLDRPR